MEFVVRLTVFGRVDDRVFESEQNARVDLELEIQVDRSFTSFFGMHVYFPRLAQRVALDEVTLVVHVEPMLDRVVLEIGDETGDVENGHVSLRAYRTQLAARSRRDPTPLAQAA